MSEQPGAPAEEPAAEKYETIAAAIGAFHERLEVERKETTKAIERAILEFKSDLRTEQRDRESAESSKRLDRSLEWSKRFTCAVAGGAICFVLFISLQECSSLHSRVTTLELKK